MTGAEGVRMYELAKKLFPICRSITGAGFRESLNIIRQIVPEIEVHHIPSGTKVFDFYINPSNPAYKSCGVEFIAEINGEKMTVVAAKKGFTVGDNQYTWGNDITNNIRICTVASGCSDGINTLRIYPVTPNVVLEKIVIYDAGKEMPKSYLGAPETFRIK